MDLFNRVTALQAVIWATQAVLKYAAHPGYPLTFRTLLITATVYPFCMLVSWTGGLLPKYSSGWIIQGWQVREHRVSGSRNRTHYLCTSLTQRCGSNRIYSNNNHTPKPFLIFFRSTYRQAPVAAHNQLKILWRCSCTARLATDPLCTPLLHLIQLPPLPPPPSLLCLAVYCCWPLAYLFVPLFPVFARR